tara:strand:- start:209 stop:1534 length:1326 start_codon:yes stop_codon:yes gene_type:complete
MDFGVYKQFTAEDEEQGLLNIFKTLESRTDVKSVKIKSGNAKTVIYIVMSDDRFNTQVLLNQQLRDAGFNVSQLFVKGISTSQETTEFLLPSGSRRRIGFKPSKGFQQTTFMASITELFPAIAFLNNISPDGSVEDFYNAILRSNPSSSGAPGPYLNATDATKGKEIVDLSEPGPDLKVKEKIKNAQNITKWLNDHNQKHPIVEAYWGYRAKPTGVDPSNPGDIFLKYANGQMLGVSLKAGSSSSKEPILNTYVKPVFDFFGKPNNYLKLKQSLYPQYREAGVSELDIKTKWGSSKLAQELGKFEKVDPKEYNRLYDINLSLVKQAVINLFNSDIKKTRKFINEQILKTQLKTPFIKVKATMTTAYVDSTYDQLSAGLQSATSIIASDPGGSKQDFNIRLSDGITLDMEFSARSNKSGFEHKLGQFENLAIKFNAISGFRR